MCVRCGRKGSPGGLKVSGYVCVHVRGVCCVVRGLYVALIKGIMSFFFALCL